jgi:hypothetical protein
MSSHSHTEARCGHMRVHICTCTCTEQGLLQQRAHILHLDDNRSAREGQGLRAAAGVSKTGPPTARTQRREACLLTLTLAHTFIRARLACAAGVIAPRKSTPTRRGDPTLLTLSAPPCPSGLWPHQDGKEGEAGGQGARHMRRKFGCAMYHPAHLTGARLLGEARWWAEERGGGEGKGGCRFVQICV